METRQKSIFSSVLFGVEGKLQSFADNFANYLKLKI